MMRTIRALRTVSLLCLLHISALFAQVDPAQISAMKWRNIGPYRAGKVNAVSGIAGDPATFYLGASGGGVWKTTDSGTTWKPIFDSESVSSIGALAIAPSNPKVLFVGSGENNVASDVANGDGVYKSDDGGANWKHVGLEDTRHIARIRIDPRNPDVVLVAAIGHGFSANAERGVFRTEDGGRTWQKVLFKDALTGAVDICFAPEDSQIVYASLYHPIRKPGGVGTEFGPGGGIYKSSDGGRTWKQVGGRGLPEGDLGRIGVAVAPGTEGKRVFAIVEAKDKANGLYVTNDAGETWQRATEDDRIRSSWYMGEVFVDPNNADVVYVPKESLYRSTDGGKTFTVIKGAPGGDDYHTLWIDPTNSNHIMLGVDQGATITLNGGESWSTWYNQPTGQFYRVATDHQWPYWVYGSQQDSGTAGIASRGNDGQITERDWFPVGWGESGYTIPNPLDPDVVYNAGPAGSMVRVSKKTGQARDISPAPIPFGTKYRLNWNTPLVFSPQDPHLLYMGTQFVMTTRDGGTTWKAISPDLTRTPEDEKDPKKPLGSIMTVAPSPVKDGVIWVGTNDGAVQLTRDGGATWKSVVPDAVSAWSTVPLIEASHYEAGAAYMAVDRNVLDDLRPHIYQTHDFGQSWEETVNGICEFCTVRSVREDPERKALLYAGTEKGVYFSLDTGGHWQSLQLNMPVAAVHDLAIEQGDLVAATYGRAFWILDDLSPLRQYNAHTLESAVLYKPRMAIRVRRDENQDTPLPPEIPAGKNPPSGAILYYTLPDDSNVRLEIYDAAGKLVRAFSSAQLPQSHEQPLQVAEYWVEHPQPMAKGRGLHRFIWDLRYESPKAVHVMTPYNYPMGAIVGETPLPPFGPMVLPGKYEVRLTVDGKALRESLEVKMDPRVHYQQKDLASAVELELKISSMLGRNYSAYEQVKSLQEKLDLLGKGSDATAKSATELDKQVSAILGESAYILDVPKDGTLMTVNDSLVSLIALVDGADFAPSAESYTATERVCAAMNSVLKNWSDLKAKQLAQFRQSAGNQVEIPDYSPIPDENSCR